MTPTEPSGFMSAVVTRAGGPLDGPDSLVDAVLPAPGAPSGHDLLVEVKAVSVNPIDLKTRVAGSPSLPDRILGWDAAGVVLAVGDEVSLFAPGDEVYYAGNLEVPGSNAQRQLVDERIVALKPTRLSYAEAAALPLTAITAWESLFDKLKLGRSSTGTMLVLGGAGGVASILIQLAKTLTGVTVIATASRPVSREWVESLGADQVVDHSAPDLPQQILAIAPGGVDYVFTAQSKGQTPLFAEVLRPFGEIVAIDNDPGVDFAALRSKALSWHWELMFARPRYGWDQLAHHKVLTAVAELIDNGTIRTTLTQTLRPLNAATMRQAHGIIERGHAIGKIVILTD